MLTLRWEKDMRYPCARDLKFSSIWETKVNTGYCILREILHTCIGIMSLSHSSLMSSTGAAARLHITLPGKAMR